MKFSNIEHLFFDLDHTLWDFDKNSGLAFESIFKKNRLELELEEFLKVYHPINQNYWKLYRENKVTKEVLRHGRIKESFLAMNRDISEDEVKQMAVDYIDHLPQYNFLLPGAIEVLEDLSARYELHIITNGFSEVQGKKMTNSGIFEFFETVTTSEEVGVKKPDREIFKFALHKAGARSENSAMIGDNLEADILGAMNIGMKVIWFNYYKEQLEMELVQIEDLKELLLYL